MFHSGADTQNIERYAEWALPARLMFGAGAGYYDVSELSGSGYGYWQAGITRPFGRIDIDLRYHDTSRSVPIISTSERAKTHCLEREVPVLVATSSFFGPSAKY